MRIGEETQFRAVFSVKSAKGLLNGWIFPQDRWRHRGSSRRGGGGKTGEKREGLRGRAKKMKKIEKTY